MSNATREINRITTAIIRISVKLIVYALIILLLYEAVTKGYAFGHEIFFAESAEEAPGRDKTITIEPDTSVNEAARLLADDGLIGSEVAFIFQSKFYDYDTIYPGVYNLNTSMTSKEILQALNVKPEKEKEKEKEDEKGTARLKTTDDTAANSAAATTAADTAAPASAGAQKANADGSGGQTAAGDGQTAADGAASGRAADGGQEAAGGTGSDQAANGGQASTAGDGAGQSANPASPIPESSVPLTDAAGQPVQDGDSGENPEDYLDEGEGDGGWIQDIGEGANR